MNFGLIPPEINSALMYAGPGAGPLLEASAAWGGLASDLSSSAAQYASAIQALDSCWQGPSAAAMSSASMKYVSWLQSTAAMAEISSSQATAAAAAYETAFAATVPPPVIAANRIRLSVLVATNFLGINTAAIAATEAEYAAMWAADAAAMYGYQAASAAATSGLPEFQPAPQTTTGTTAQGITQPAASSGGWNIFAPGSNTETTGLSGLLNLLSGQTDSAFGSFINSSFLNSIGSSAVFNPGETYAPLAALAALLPAFQQMGQSMEGESSGVGSSVSGFGGTGYGSPGLSGGNYPVVGAAVGNGEAVGGLSAPPAWQKAVGASSVRPMGATPLGNVSGGNMAVPMGLPVGGKGKDGQQQPRYGFPIKVINSHPAGG